MLRNLILVAIGGAAGSVLRYLLAWALNGQTMLPWPLGTLAANLIGCFLVGLILGYQRQLTEGQMLVLATGFCGGLTTLSTLEAESLQLAQRQLWLAVGYGLGSVFLGFGAVWAGLTLARA